MYHGLCHVCIAWARIGCTWPVLWHLKGREQLGNTQDLQWEHGRICRPHNWHEGGGGKHLLHYLKAKFLIVFP